MITLDKLPRMSRCQHGRHGRGRAPVAVVRATRQPPRVCVCGKPSVHVHAAELLCERCVSILRSNHQITHYEIETLKGAPA